MLKDIFKDKDDKNEKNEKDDKDTKSTKGDKDDKDAKSSKSVNDDTKDKNPKKDEETDDEQKPNTANEDLTIANIKSNLGKSPDVKFKEVLISNKKSLPATLVFIDGLVNNAYISDFILKPLVQEEAFEEARVLDDVYKLIKDGMLYYASQSEAKDLNEAIQEILLGSAVLVLDELKKAFVYDIKGAEKRSITEPTSENVIKGAKDSFVETFRVNTASVRRKIKSPHLVIEQTIVGRQTNTPVGIVYMDNIANSKLVNDVKNKINGLNIDRVVTTGFIEEALTNDNSSTFPQVKSTERPDTFCADIVDGRVGVIVDGLPITFIVPGTFIMFLQAPEDYSRNFVVSTIIRLLRYSLLLITLVMPGLYIAITSFHPEMLPTDLVLSISSSKLGVPFPTFFETMLMLVAFEILFEAGLRMPRSIGQTVSIVGALIVGQAAVEAKIISPSVVIVIAFTAIASFTMPNQDLSNSLRIYRFLIAIASSILGAFGLMMALILLTLRLCKIETFGIAYLSPLVSSKDDILADTLFRYPSRAMKYRPEELNVKNKRRQG